MIGLNWMSSSRLTENYDLRGCHYFITILFIDNQFEVMLQTILCSTNDQHYFDQFPNYDYQNFNENQWIVLVDNSEN